MSEATATAALLARLERHYIKPGEGLPGGMFLPEVTYGGMGGPRADALYVGFTSASGRTLVGHELKVSRADWRRELDKPGKADAWADECHAWYVVAPSTSVVPPNELPAGWGLMTVAGRASVRLNIVVKATVHADRVPSWTAVRSLLSRADTLRNAAVNQARTTARDNVRAEVEHLSRLTREAEDRALTAAKQALATIADALGVREVTSHSHPSGGWGRGDYLTAGDLREASTFIRAHRDIAAAARALSQGHSLGRIRDLADQLQTAIDNATCLHTTAKEALS